ncbi:hypothetical protein HDU67_007326 [Dinochytrium kinnereticum]|nr:hypothetical protein HDU67_007326 [Dinochytrium kinnereticum]
MNDFLRQHRDQVKDYLQYAAQEDYVPECAAEAPIIKSPVPLREVKSDLNSKRKTLSSSMPSLNLSPLELSLEDTKSSHHNHFYNHHKFETTRSNSSTSTLRLSSKFQLSESSDLDELFIHIGHSLDIIESDIEERIVHLSPSEADGVLANFFEMKKLVENSPFARKTPYDTNESSLGKASIYIAKWSRSFKGIFSSNTLPLQPPRLIMILDHNQGPQETTWWEWVIGAGEIRRSAYIHGNSASKAQALPPA